MTHELRSNVPAFPFELDERLTHKGLGTVDAGVMLRKRIGLKEGKSEGAVISPLYILASARSAHYGNSLARYSSNASTYSGLTNVFGPSATYQHTSKLMDILNERNIIKLRKGVPYGHVRGLGQSTFYGDDALCEMTADFGQEFVRSAIIRMREANGAYSAPPTGIEYDSRWGEVDRLNSSLSGLKLNFANCGQIKGQVLHTFGGVVLQKPIYLHRTFEGEYDRGGTIGCRTYQDIKKGARKSILMDGGEVVEIEFPHLLAFQAYQRAGAVTTHGVRSLAERRQTPIVPSTVLNVLAPEMMRAVATTVRTAASPLADHMAR